MSITATATIVSLLSPILGDMAKDVVKKLAESRGGESKLKSALDATNAGVSIVQALKNEFGEQFSQALNSMNQNLKRQWSHEAGTQEYIYLDLSNRSQKEVVIALRDEININLDRLTHLPNSQSEDDIKNYFSGVFSKWRERYRGVYGNSEEDDSIFLAADDLLNGKARNFKEVMELLMRTSLGTVGAGMIIIGVFTTFGIGVGALQGLSIWIFGIPWVTVGALVVPGAILVLLARYKFTSRHAMTTCINLAYKLLERRSVAFSVSK